MTGIELLKRFEGCKLKAYPDPATGGVPWTIGWGSTRDRNGRAIKPGMQITQKEADSLLERDFDLVLCDVNSDPNIKKLPSGCKEAIACLCYNIKGGFLSFKKSKCYAGIVAHNVADVYHEWDWGVAQKGVGLGLARRRAKELDFFLSNWK